MPHLLYAIYFLVFLGGPNLLIILTRTHPHKFSWLNSPEYKEHRRVGDIYEKIRHNLSINEIDGISRTTLVMSVLETGEAYHKVIPDWFKKFTESYMGIMLINIIVFGFYVAYCLDFFN